MNPPVDKFRPPADADPTIIALFDHGKVACTYHPAVKSFKLDHSQDGRPVYARVTPIQNGICYLDLHYGDDDSRIWTRNPQYFLRDVGMPRAPMWCIGENFYDGWKPQMYMVNTKRRYQICTKGTNNVVATVFFHPYVWSNEANAMVQELGAIVEPASIVFKSKWDDPEVNPSQAMVREAVRKTLASKGQS